MPICQSSDVRRQINVNQALVGLLAVCRQLLLAPWWQDSQIRRQGSFRVCIGGVNKVLLQVTTGSVQMMLLKEMLRIVGLLFGLKGAAFAAEEMIMVICTEFVAAVY